MTSTIFNRAKKNNELTNFFSELEKNSNSNLLGLFENKPALIEQLEKLAKHSIYAQKVILRHPDFLTSIIRDDSLDKNFAYKDYLRKIETALKNVKEQEALDRKLRLFRAEMIIRIMWRDFNRIVTMNETTSELSYLAQSCIQMALDFHYEKLTKKHGIPLNDKQEHQAFIVIAMGKLGANELNLSSDIDLIFTYPEKGNTDSQENTIDNQGFFSKLSKRIIKTLDHQTDEGFVFRVDMRLRPFGQSGPIVSSFAALEEYYLNQGRDWERLAMIKANIIAHNATNENLIQLTKLQKNFVYRKYIDYSVIDSLRNLKKMITQEVQRRKLGDDIKLGEGGIREIEFIAQTFQLVRGGKDSELQDRRILNILPKLAKLNYLSEKSVRELMSAYIFLRNTEHGLQGYNNEQTHRLPTSSIRKNNLAQLMGFDSWDTFYVTLEKHRKIVNEEFLKIIDSNVLEDTQPNTSQRVWEEFWQVNLNQKDCIQILETNLHENPKQSLYVLEDLKNFVKNKNLHPLSKQRIDQFVPIMLAAVSEDSATPTKTLQRLHTLVKAIIRRSAYLILLIENPKALTRLIKLTELSPWISDQLSKYPVLLDELIDIRTLYSLPNRNTLDDELRRMMLRIPQNDIEDQMETLRYFRSSHGFRVATCETTGTLPLMNVSDYLTFVAETILKFVLQMCWDELTQKYGYPDGQEREVPPFIILGYGKLGGIELSHGSDLDLVFVHQSTIGGSTDGKKKIDNQTFFLRLGQKIIHILSTRTHTGLLYEIDMRLRPSGNSGLLVASLDAFSKYQKENASTWEHQALVRTRVIAGDGQLGDRFADIRNDVLCQKRVQTQLKQEVVNMRLKMRNHLGSDKENDGIKQFHLKHDPGGIVDIEFMVQYMVLAWSNSDPTLVTYTDNIRILENLAKSNLLSAHKADQLIDAYKTYRSFGHLLTLQQLPPTVEPKMFAAQKEIVIQIWDSIFNGD